MSFGFQSPIFELRTPAPGSQGGWGPVREFDQAFIAMPKFSQTASTELQAFLFTLRNDYRPESVAAVIANRPTVPPDAPEWWTLMPQALERFKELPAYTKGFTPAEVAAWKKFMPDWIPPATNVLPPEMQRWWDKHRPKVIDPGMPKKVMPPEPPKKPTPPPVPPPAPPAPPAPPPAPPDPPAPPAPPPVPPPAPPTVLPPLPPMLELLPPRPVPAPKSRLWLWILLAALVLVAVFSSKK